jgi:hypothetical protein
MTNCCCGIVQPLEGGIGMHSELCQGMPFRHTVQQLQQMRVIWLREQTIDYGNDILDRKNTN